MANKPLAGRAKTLTPLQLQRGALAAVAVILAVGLVAVSVQSGQRRVDHDRGDRVAVAGGASAPTNPLASATVAQAAASAVTTPTAQVAQTSGKVASSSATLPGASVG